MQSTWSNGSDVSTCTRQCPVCARNLALKHVKRKYKQFQLSLCFCPQLPKKTKQNKNKRFVHLFLRRGGHESWRTWTRTSSRDTRGRKGEDTTTLSRFQQVLAEGCLVWYLRGHSGGDFSSTCRTDNESDISLYFPKKHLCHLQATAGSLPPRVSRAVRAEGNVLRRAPFWYRPWESRIRLPWSTACLKTTGKTGTCPSGIALCSRLEEVQLVAKAQVAPISGRRYAAATRREVLPRFCSSSFWLYFIIGVLFYPFAWKTNKFLRFSVHKRNERQLLCSGIPHWPAEPPFISLSPKDGRANQGR